MDGNTFFPHKVVQAENKYLMNVFVVLYVPKQNMNHAEDFGASKEHVLLDFIVKGKSNSHMVASKRMEFVPN